jgi:hypothetical protein
MPLIHKITILPKAWRQLGSETLWLYAKYQFKLRNGWLRMQTPGGRKAETPDQEPKIILQPASKEKFEELLGKRVQEILDAADEILRGQVRLFGGEARILELKPTIPLKHWTSYQSQMPEGRDIKPVWEMGRFCWAITLARAYWISGKNTYSEGFWKYFGGFRELYPPNLGPHWSSAQEVALRLISFAFCYSLISKAAATTDARKQAMGVAIIEHAERIPPTIDYARAQNNNHLLSEAIGLVTAAAMLPSHPRAKTWKTLGRQYFVEGIQKQIHDDGAYAQHSSNYHRLMLQLGVWATIIEKDLPHQAMGKLNAASDWLCALLDEESGRVPNLGPNDGAYILPLTILPNEDYRPALQAASLALKGETTLPPGIWDEMGLWLGLRTPSPPSSLVAAEGGSLGTGSLPQSSRGVSGVIESGAAKPDIANKQNNSPLRLEGKNTWAYLRAAEFKERPGHADQLHVDIWWRGLNVAQDAGSYLYSAPAPWDNALAGTRVHNTITVNGQETMTRAGRFLWLDWVQAKFLSTKRTQGGQLIGAAAQHEGYKKLGVLHRREVNWNVNRWVITDHLLPTRDSEKEFRVRVHWLLPDWDWQIDAQEMRIESPHGEIEIAMDVSVGDLAELKLFREGKLVHGSGEDDAILGWASPTYGVKVAALSFVADAQGPLPITMISTWTFPK